MLAEPGHEIYWTEIISHEREVEALGKDLEPLFDPEICDTKPDFFLASITPRLWKPRIVAVRQRGELIGALYTKERKLRGFPTGLVYGDATLNAMVIAKPPERGAVFYAGLKSLLESRTLGLRLQLPPAGYEMQTLPSLVRHFGLEYTAFPSQNHLVLPLGRSYDEFLGHVGPRTRRNFRYYRRRFESEGHIYVEDVPLSEFRSAAFGLLQQKVIGADREGLSRALAMVAHARRPLLAGLRSTDGDWLSLVGGWSEGTRHVIFLQMNSDRHHSRSSLCLVLRGYLFESLIRKGIRNVVFWAGVGEPLNRYSTPIPTLSVYVDKPYKIWRQVRQLVANGIRRLPPEIAWRAHWIAPNGNAGGQSGPSRESIEWSDDC